jgi:hypothetical protein
VQSLLLALTIIVSLSCFLRLCNMSLLPATCFLKCIDADADIAPIELTINDQRNNTQAEGYECPLCALLALPAKLTVVHVQIFGQMFTSVGDLHTVFL